MRIPTALALPLLLLSCTGDAEPRIDPDELAARIAAGDAPFVLDVRTAEEFDAGHIPGAVNIPHSELASRLDELQVSKDAEIVVHCESGRRAGIAEAILVEEGFTNVRDLSGHMSAWREAGRPLE